MIPALRPGFFRGAGGAAAEGATAWSPTRKTAGVALSNGSRTATVPSGVVTNEEIRSNGTRSAGKRYFEIGMSSLTGSSSQVMPGITLNTAVINGSQTTTGKITYRSNGEVRNGATLITTVAGYGSGAVIGVAVDYDAGKVWFAVGNNYISGGNPATGANPSATFTANTITEALLVYDNQNAQREITSQFVAGQLSFSPPSGFSAGF